MCDFDGRSFFFSDESKVVCGVQRYISARIHLIMYKCQFHVTRWGRMSGMQISPCTASPTMCETTPGDACAAHYGISGIIVCAWQIETRCICNWSERIYIYDIDGHIFKRCFFSQVYHTSMARIVVVGRSTQFAAVNFSSAAKIIHTHTMRTNAHYSLRSMP